MKRKGWKTIDDSQVRQIWSDPDNGKEKAFSLMDIYDCGHPYTDGTQLEMRYLRTEIHIKEIEQEPFSRT